MLSEWIRNRAERNGGRVAVREISGGERTYADLDENATQLAAGYDALGLKQGEHVARLMLNSLEGIDAWFGMIRAGIVEVPVNTGNVGMSLEYVLNNSDSKAVVVDEGLLPRLESIAPQLPKIEHVIVNRGGSDRVEVDLPAHIVVHDLADVYTAGAPGYQEPQLDATSVASIVYSSGTTGPSKGIVTTHSFTHTVTTWTADVMQYTENDTILTYFPLFHLMARNCGLLAAMETNGRLVLGDKFSAGAFWQMCRDHDITAITYLGDMCRILANQPLREDDADNPVRRAFGAGLPGDLWESFEKRFGIECTEIYGMTELGGVLQNTSMDRRVGSVGRPAAHFEVRVHDDQDRPVDPGVTGELVVRQRLPEVMIREYYRMPEETIRAFRNLWFHTGDRVYRDEDGYFYFVDRTKDMIRRKGENISSFEVERVFCSHPAVLEAAAYSVVVDGFEEVMVALVLTEPATDPDISGLVDVARANLPKFAIPRFLRVIDEIPRNASQRPLKFQLRDEGVTSDTQDMAALSSAP